MSEQEQAAEQQTTAPEEPLETRVAKLVEQIRPYIQMDGGDIEFDRIENNVVYIYMKGACVGCPSSMYTLKMGLERQICERFPEIVAVEAN